MSCYHPLVGIPTDCLTENGKKKIKIIGNEWFKKHSLTELNKLNGIVIPCGHCIGCRLDYSRSWADRMMLELETAKKGIFLTLTYDNKHVPVSEYQDFGKWSDIGQEMIDDLGLVFDGEEWLIPKTYTLCKRDFQLFMKKLRKEFAKDWLKIRFFASGEYGSQTDRPHYHAIIFGIGLDDIGDCVPTGRNDIGQPYFKSEKIRKIWDNGHILVTDVSFETCAYVARYVVKKLSGDMAIDYAKKNRIPEFSLMSRKPGIGAYYLELHPECLDYENINLSTKDKGLKIRIPKYYLKQMQLTDPARYEKMMEQRKRLASDSMMLQLQNTSLNYLEYLEVKEENRKQKIKVLKRK